MKSSLTLPTLFLASIALCATTAGAQPWTRHTLDASSAKEGKLGANGARLLDANHDNLPDVVTGWINGDAIRVCLNPGPRKSKNPWPAVTVGRVKGAEDAVFADLDNDGNLDVVTCAGGDTNTIFIHWAPAKKKYLDPKAWETAAVPATEKLQSWMFALPYEVDGYNGIDLIVGSKGQHGAIGWLESPENPRDTKAWKYHELQPAASIMSIHSVDIDNDGYKDILYADRTGKYQGVHWLKYPGIENLAPDEPWTRHLVRQSRTETMLIDVANLDGEKGDEVLVATKEGGIMILTRPKNVTSNKWPGTVTVVQEGIGTEKAVRVGDINLDGRMDLILTCEDAGENGSGAVWLENTGPSAVSGWDLHDISGPQGVKFDRIELLDLDNDGDLDLLTTEELANLGVVWFENPAR